MSITQRRTHEGADVVTEDQVVTSSAARKALAVLRFGFGFTFLWAFFDKLFALGFHTGVSTNPETGVETVDRFGDAAWINGADPAAGFLAFGSNPDSPFHGFYSSLVTMTDQGPQSDWWVSPLFMIGLLGIGVALTLGIGMRIAAVSGVLLYTMMYTAVMLPENNPILDDHILGAISLAVLALTLSGDTWGLGKAWARIGIVRKHSFLR
jgi:thiosulfate dehydrogenase [quinone] large subunit